MRALLLTLSFLQVAILAPARMAPGHCEVHAPGAQGGEHATGHEEQRAPEPGGDCTHCPPADCARHQACTQATAAVVAEPDAVPPHRPATRSSHRSPLALHSADRAPPTQPPRLIA